MSPKFEKLDKNLTLYMMVSYHRQPMFLLQVEKYLTSVNLWAPSDFEFIVNDKKKLTNETGRGGFSLPF
jgi:hypothetical protein